MEENDGNRSDRRRSSRRSRSKSRSRKAPKQGAQGQESTPETAAGGVRKPGEGERSGSQRRRRGPQRGDAKGAQGRRPDSRKDRGDTPERKDEQAGAQGRQAQSPRQGGRGNRGSQRAETNDRDLKSLVGTELLTRPQRRSRSGGRPSWTPPDTASVALPDLICSRCGKPIDDVAAAVQDGKEGIVAHFDCVVESLAREEPLVEGERIVYLGGGRFGIVHFENPADPRRFRIVKTIQWEEKDKRATWRKTVADRYSAT